VVARSQLNFELGITPSEGQHSQSDLDLTFGINQSTLVRTLTKIKFVEKWPLFN